MVERITCDDCVTCHLCGCRRKREQVVLYETSYTCVCCEDVAVPTLTTSEFQWPYYTWVDEMIDRFGAVNFVGCKQMRREELLMLPGLFLAVGVRSRSRSKSRSRSQSPRQSPRQSHSQSPPPQRPWSPQSYDEAQRAPPETPPEVDPLPEDAAAQAKWLLYRIISEEKNDIELKWGDIQWDNDEFIQEINSTEFDDKTALDWAEQVYEDGHFVVVALTEIKEKAGTSQAHSANY